LSSSQPPRQWRPYGPSHVVKAPRVRAHMILPAIVSSLLFLVILLSGGGCWPSAYR